MSSSKTYPRRDFKAMSELLQSMGIMNYGKKVLPFMIDFTRNYAHSVLDEADELAMRSKKKKFDITDVRKAIKNLRKKLYYKQSLRMEAAVGENSNSSTENLKPELNSSVIENTIGSQIPLAPIPSTSHMDDYVHTVLNEANDTESSSDEKLVISSRVRTIKNKRNSKPYQRPPVKKKVTTANSHLTEVTENKPTLTTINTNSDYPVTTTSPSTTPVDNKHSLSEETNESSTGSNEKALGISSVQEETKPDREKLEVGSPPREKITRKRRGGSTEINKRKPLPTSSTVEVDSNTQSTNLPSTSCAEKSTLDETRDSGVSCSKEASDISNVCKSTKNERNELEVQSPAKKNPTGSSSSSEANKPKPLLTFSTVEVDSPAKKNPTGSSSSSEANKPKPLLTFSTVEVDSPAKKNPTGSSSRSEANKPKLLLTSSTVEVDSPAKKKTTMAGSSSRSEANEPKPLLTSSTVEVDSKSQSSVVAVPSTSSAHDDVHNEANALSTDCDKKTSSVFGIKRKARTRKNKSNNEESQPLQKITKTSSPKTTGRNKPKPFPASSIFQVDRLPVAKVTKTYSRKPTGKSEPKSFPPPSIPEADKISQNSAITLPSTSFAGLAHSVPNESNKSATNSRKKPLNATSVRRSTRNNRNNEPKKKSPSKEGTKTHLIVKFKRKTPPLSSLKKEVDNDVQGPGAKLPSSSRKVISLEDYVNSIKNEANELTSNHNIKASDIFSPQKRKETQKIKVERGSKSPSSASAVPSTASSSAYGESILKLLQMCEADENMKKGVKLEKDAETELSSADVNQMKSPIIVRVTQVVEDDDYDKN